MAKFLVIQESFTKSKKTKAYLGKDYNCMASVGHVIDLPAKKISVDIKNNFTPSYEVMPDKKKVLNDILKAAKKVDTVYLMSDPDREGEAIAWHISTHLPAGTKFKRAKTNSITKKAVKDAIDNAADIDMDLVDAYEARRILDRLCGYKCSFLVKQATGGASAGRTQSSGLRILAEREKEIKSFIPVIYWPVETELLTDKHEKIIALIKTPKPLDISTKKEAEEIINTLKTKDILVSKYDVKTEKAKPYAPFTTSTLQQSASSFLGFSPDRTMKAAQKLYEVGAITYHRTDSVSIVSNFVDSTVDYIKNNYKKDYLPSKKNFYKAKSKNAQEAHEAIRPTDVLVKEWIGSGSDEAKIYKMVWKRVVASQMSPAIYERRSAEFKCQKYVLSANGSKEMFDGFRLVWDYSDISDKFLPDLKIGDKVILIDAKTEKKQTKPPTRFSEASFIKELEKMGIGRPSTYATIPKTLKARGYVEVGKGKSIVTTDLGIGVSDFLIKADFCFIDLKFTSSMEDELDEVSNGNSAKLAVLDKFWTRLKKDIDNANGLKKKINLTDYDCPKCKSKLSLKHSKFGKFYGCSGYPNCKYTAKISKDGKPIEKEKKEIVYSDHKCPKCKSKMIERKSKYGKFFGCSTYPKCKGMRDSEGDPIKSKK
jgi:DNA topoisomerase I